MPVQAQDEADYRVIPSLSEWIEEINNWPDSVYKVENIKIVIDGQKDSLITENYLMHLNTPEPIQAVITKEVDINRLIVDNDFGRDGNNYNIKNIRFKEKVRLNDYQSLVLHTRNLVFEKEFRVSDHTRPTYFNFISVQFKSWIGFFDIQSEIFVNIQGSNIGQHIQFTRTPGKPGLNIESSDISRVSLGLSKLSELFIRNSHVKEITLQSAVVEAAVHMIDNLIDSIEISGAQFPGNNTYIPFEQVSGKLFADPLSMTTPIRIKYFVSDTMNFELQEEYDALIASYKLLLNGYQNRGDQDSYNACFVEMKNIETRRLAFLYKKNPTFKGYFTWKINQFLKVFSAYGTEPAKAVIVSMYVILTFALIYLFFPNHWDSHGKNRMKDRYLFFMKYMSVDKGIRDVYLEEKMEEIAEGESFRQVLENYREEVPSLFYKSAQPLYKWSVASTRIAAGMLTYFDFLKGTWKNTDPTVRTGKTVLVTVIFFFALLYDLFIKVLNAVMLSINTFTTLGFGEIPIKGLPRYLAIIQGFIGWFMLTIFSVSLISQLLN